MGVFIVTVLCILAIFFVSDELIAGLIRWADDRMLRSIIYDGVVCELQKENKDFTESSAFRRKYKKAFDEYKIVVDFILNQRRLDDVLVDQVIDRIHGLVTH